MAKTTRKRTTKKVASKRSKTAPSDPRQALVDLVSLSDLVLIRLNSLAVERDDKPSAEVLRHNSMMDVTLGHRYEPREDGPPRLHYDLYINSIATPKEKGPTVTLVCSFTAVYKLQPGTPQPPQTVVEAFGQEVALFAMWPYWREIAQSMCLRLHVPPLPIPFLRRDVVAQFKPREASPDIWK